MIAQLLPHSSGVSCVGYRLLLLHLILDSYLTDSCFKPTDGSRHIGGWSFSARGIFSHFILPVIVTIIVI
jgi:hypothetical protein